MRKCGNSDQAPRQGDRDLPRAFVRKIEQVSRASNLQASWGSKGSDSTLDIDTLRQNSSSVGKDLRRFGSKRLVVEIVEKLRLANVSHAPISLLAVRLRVTVRCSRCTSRGIEVRILKGLCVTATATGLSRSY